MSCQKEFGVKGGIFLRGYPVMLNLLGKRVVVIGGGKIATRKIQTLLQSDATIIVVSPNITETLAQFVSKQRITWYEKNYQLSDLDHAFIVIAATNDNELNKTIAKDCQPYQLVNVVSEGTYGNFIVPASFRRGKLTIAVSTDGVNPSAAKHIRDELAFVHDETYANYINCLKVRH